MHNQQDAVEIIEERVVIRINVLFWHPFIDAVSCRANEFNSRVDEGARKLVFRPDGYSFSIRRQSPCSEELRVYLERPGPEDLDSGTLHLQYHSENLARVAGCKDNEFEVRYDEHGGAYLRDRCSNELSLEEAAESVLKWFALNAGVTIARPHPNA